ncbi:hypothetical protein Godav_002940, partial [Gossypium davidsonii]|nr:hypothetical protein [Gossypium davidsonii]
MDTIRGSGNSDSNLERVFTKFISLARESRVGQICNRGVAPDRQSPTTSEYMEMWEDWYEYLPTRESIIVLELLCVSKYIWFRIHCKSYLLTPEERQRQIRVERESGHTIIRPNESTDIITRRSSSTDDTHAIAFSDDASLMAGWSQMSGLALFPVMPRELPMYRPAAHERSQGGPSGSSPFYQSLPTYKFQTPLSFLMQTPPHTLFFEDGLSSQVRQSD